MKIGFYIVSLFFMTSVVASTDLTLPIVRVIDGDTIVTEVKEHPEPLQKIYIRLKGIDTPELRKYKCQEEKVLANKAKEFLTEWLKPYKIMTIKNYGFDKYGQRIVGDAYVDGQSLSELMIEKGFARPYSGKVAKESWCK